MMEPWFREGVVDPLNDLLESVPVGDEVRERDRCDKLAGGIEGVFRRVGTQYVDWRSEWITDGSSVHLCVRVDADTLDVAGMTCIGFDGCLFPYRATIRRMSDGAATVTVYIGEVDLVAGEPPRMPPGTVILAVRDELGNKPVAELLLRRKQMPLTWTKVLDFP